MPETSTSLDSIFQVRGKDVYELLAFAVAGEDFAVELSTVHEIVVPPPLTLVPRGPAAVLGVCSVRGRLVTVVDVRTLLGLPPRPTDKKTRILLGKGAEDELMGLVVDEVRQVVRLLPSEFETVGGASGESELVRAIARPASGSEIVVFELGHLLARGAA
jgi:purine-binding chemotaxis protein CheW